MVPTTSYTFLTHRARVSCHFSSNIGSEFEILDMNSIKDFDFNLKVNGEDFKQGNNMAWHRGNFTGLYWGDYSAPVKINICLHMVASFELDVMIVCCLAGDSPPLPPSTFVQKGLTMLLTSLFWVFVYCVWFSCLLGMYCIVESCDVGILWLSKHQYLV